MATFNGTAGKDTLPGLLGILTGLGDDEINGLGGAGNDVLIGGGGADSLQGGAGTTDTADHSGSAAPVTVNLTTGTGSGGDAQGDTLTGIERLIGSAGDDALTGSAGIGTGGDAQGDTLTGITNAVGSAFNDALTGNGTGTLDGLAGNDTLSGAATLNGEDGNDTLIGGALIETLNGGADNDTVSYAGSAVGVTVNLSLLGPQISLGDASGDTLTGIENLRGSLFTDVLTGDAGDNILNDGGVGGSDTLAGGVGNDSYSVYNAGAVIVEAGGEGNDRVSAGVSYVLADGVSVEYLNTTSLNATYAVNLTGNDLAQLVRGNAGANVLDGADGNDVLFGMGGADIFRFSTALGAGNVDRIGDFSVGDDKIQLDSAIFIALGIRPVGRFGVRGQFPGAERCRRPYLLQFEHRLAVL
ncbi:calcium-binding protein [Mesorhizobium sp. ASY16-5R]|uniref:calcium-binding protein n=1 Tax=Mesorhizobium sp. ASY16-5R TaxID=3445772 RepID=UPI003F9F4A28